MIAHRTSRGCGRRNRPSYPFVEVCKIAGPSQARNRPAGAVFETARPRVAVRAPGALLRARNAISAGWALSLCGLEWTLSIRRTALAPLADTRRNVIQAMQPPELASGSGRPPPGGRFYNRASS
ncbi:hypothetical protein AIOL_002890 [Candidatus Rhodobacter oscarellae]|uniref:Uncharacterized protein n=1 Tax=Candidatus Rhodobacter oscarellae TaxID=1675527 RepID=A0A0J9E591_9RHOB|nr:hypothetical protein AIOL_002890 [Candidatus Rhodobacter lobularis]